MIILYSCYNKTYKNKFKSLNIRKITLNSLPAIDAIPCALSFCNFLLCSLL